MYKKTKEYKKWWPFWNKVYKSTEILTTIMYSSSTKAKRRHFSQQSPIHRVLTVSYAHYTFCRGISNIILVYSSPTHMQ